MSRSPSPLTVNLLFALLCLLWGSTWLVIKGGLRDLPPFTSAGLRFVTAAAIMAVVAHLLHRREGGRRPPVWLTVVMGLGNFSVSYGLVYWCETLLPSGLVSVLWAVFPMMMALAAHLFLPGERLGPRQWSGFLVGFAGVGLLYSTDVASFGTDALPAALLLLLSPLVAAVATTLVKRHGGHVSSVLLNRNGMALGALLLVGFALLAERDATIRWTPMAIFSVAYLAGFGTVLTFGLYFWLMRYAPAHRLSLIAYVIPAVALTLGWAVADEPVRATTLGGTALILAGVFLVMRR